LYGLGSILNQGAQDIYPAMILVAMVSVGLCGAITTAMLGYIEGKAMPWRRERAAS
jgi:taurine transport system permease protein